MLVRLNEIKIADWEETAAGSTKTSDIHHSEYKI
jgi:hypothetical protein